MIKSGRFYVDVGFVQAFKRSISKTFCLDFPKKVFIFKSMFV